jgi:hypothetical protein
MPDYSAIPLNTPTVTVNDSIKTITVTRYPGGYGDAATLKADAAAATVANALKL